MDGRQPGPGPNLLEWPETRLSQRQQGAVSSVDAEAPSSKEFGAYE